VEVGTLTPVEGSCILIICHLCATEDGLSSVPMHMLHVLSGVDQLLRGAQLGLCLMSQDPKPRLHSQASPLGQSLLSSAFLNE
jgi:hypothetical protein